VGNGGSEMDEEKGYIKITADTTEVTLSYRLKPNTLDRMLKIVERITSKKLLKRLLCQSRKISRKK
jgi:hypothetical protein